MNNSGVIPVGGRVLIKPDVIDEFSEGGILIPEEHRQAHQRAQMSGILVDVGPDAWMHTTTIVKRLMDGQLKVVEERTTGYSKPFAKIGDRISFEPWVGRNFDGEDGEQYRMLNDEDITGTVSDKVDFTEMRSRAPLGNQGDRDVRARLRA